MDERKVKCTWCESVFPEGELIDAEDGWQEVCPYCHEIGCIMDLPENSEELVRCQWCDEELPKDEALKEKGIGWLCERCARAILSRGEELTFAKG